MIRYFRIVYKDGSVGAWSKDYESIVECAKYFGGRVEEKVVNLD